MRKIGIVVGVFLLLGILYYLYQKDEGPVGPPTSPVLTPVESKAVEPAVKVTQPPPPPPTPKVDVVKEDIEEKSTPPPPPPPVQIEQPEPKTAEQPGEEPPVVQPPPEMIPPPIKIHKELIPKNIEIIRVYYENDFTGPGRKIGFDINGSGFTKEFEDMIEVDSGHPAVKVVNLKLKTLNQIHGSLHVGKKVPTTAIFPQVLIKEKVVFRAKRPFAVIRPGEVLNLAITEMGQSGREGRFRVFTNLTKKMFKDFSIISSTPTIRILNLKPTLPYLVDADIIIGRATAGSYDLTVKLKDKKIWERSGFIRIVAPNVGDSGLAQHIFPVDKYHRPGDKARFVVHGSGFRPTDVNLLSIKVSGWETTPSTFTYVAPGRMEVSFDVPLSAAVSGYNLHVMNGDKSILKKSDAFVVVGNNWTRSLKLDPSLVPGGKSTLILEGRDMDPSFISSIQIEVDEPYLFIDPFILQNEKKATAQIIAGPNVAPGDYWVKLKTENGPISPHFGSIIRIINKK
ncbi:hypothetical protein BVX98_06300 [bacterium F11]|nr:hypothetical protein BVX98_06300 [bacterium F11]